MARPSAAAGSSLRTTAASTFCSFNAWALAHTFADSTRDNWTRARSEAISRFKAEKNFRPTSFTGTVAIRSV